jgi:hypothetical protein
VHTHFGSATHLFSVFLGVLLVGGLWRIGWMRALKSRHPLIHGLAKAALVQY